LSAACGRREAGRGRDAQARGEHRPRHTALRPAEAAFISHRRTGLLRAERLDSPRRAAASRSLGSAQASQGTQERALWAGRPGHPVSTKEE
ncbi:hypothetical protein P7K49_025038, partial [Saguinus oedipus]